MEAIAGALILSVGCAVGGSIATGKDFWINVLANLVFLGPGLLITNVFARNWRDRRQRQWVIDRVETAITPINHVLSEVILRHHYMAVSERFQTIISSIIRLPESLYLSKLQFIQAGIAEIYEAYFSVDPDLLSRLEATSWAPLERYELDALREAVTELRLVLPIHLAELALQQAEHYLDEIKGHPGNAYMYRRVLGRLGKFAYEIERQLPR